MGRRKRVETSGMLFALSQDAGNKILVTAGLGLSVRFSTSLIVQFVLLNSALISLSLYSALVATAVFMKPVILGVLSWALSRGKPP